MQSVILPKRRQVTSGYRGRRRMQESLSLCKCHFMDFGQFHRTRSFPAYHKHLGACFQKSPLAKHRNEDVCAQLSSGCDPFL